jgi:hypothetical protein
MQAAMLETRFGGGPPSVRTVRPQSSGAVGNAADRLAHIKELRDKDLISQDEYDAKRKAILDEL